MSVPSKGILLVGDGKDPHVQAVGDLVPADRLVTFDAAWFQVVERITPETTVLITASGSKVVLPDPSTRGWIRRLAPVAWDHGVELGSRRAAAMASRVALVATIMREQSVSWLTPVDYLYTAENKIVQYRAAISAGIRIPRTIIAFDRHDVARELGEPFILKPLGPGNFETEGRQHVVYVAEHQSRDLAEVDFVAAPFIAQSAIKARKHLRVITVGEQSWAAELDAAGLPVDWRSYGPAHRSFHAADWPDVRREAVVLACALRTGMSCQDWIVDGDGPVFVDLNPSGQWLFLPDDVAGPATRALAAWLMGTA